MSPFISLFLFITLLSLNSAQITIPTELEFPAEELVPTEETPEEQPLAGYVPLDLAQVQNNPLLQGLFSTGAQNATQQAIQDGALPQATYQLVKLVSVEQNQDLATVQDYRFVADIRNNLGQNFTIQFELFYHPDTRTSEVTSYSILGQETEQPIEQETELESPQEEGLIPSEEGVLGGGYVPLDLDQAATDPQIQGLLQIGLKNATDQAIQDKLLKNGTYQAIQTLNIEQNQDVQNVEEYLFDVIISAVDNTNHTARLTYQLTYDPLTGNPQVTSYSILNNELEPPETYTPLDLDTISTNPTIQGLITVGFNNVTQQAIQNDSLPNGTYLVSKTNSAGQGNINSSNYQFNISITDNRGTTADEYFTLNYDNATQFVNVTSYNISNLHVPTTPPPKNNHTNSGSSSEIPKGFTELNVNSNQDPYAYNVGKYGYNYVIAAAMLAGKIPYSFYSLESVNQVARKIDGRKRQYWYDVTVADGLGNSADLIYTVEYDTRRGTSDVLNYDMKNVVSAT